MPGLLEWLTCPVHGLPALVVNLWPQIGLALLMIRRKDNDVT